MHSCFAAAGVLLALCLGPAAMAGQVPPAGAHQENAPQAGQPPAWPQRAGILVQTPVTLKDVIARVLANNKDIQTAQANQQAAYYNWRAALGVYDPLLGAQSYWQRNVTPVSSIISGAEGGRLIQREITAVPQLTGLIPGTGASYQVNLSNSRLSTNNQFVTLNPQFPTSLNLSFTQPLWRGFAIDQNRWRIQVAKKNESLTDAQFRQQVIGSVAQAAVAYWDLAYAIRNLQVQVQAADLARQQVESNQRMADRGVLAPIQVNEAETQLYTFQQNVYLGQAALTRAENALKALMLPDLADPLWSSALVPITPAETETPVVPLADALQEALARRPELEQARLTAEINQADVRYYRNQTKPQVDLIANYTSNGLSGALIPPGPNPFTGAFDELFARVNTLSQTAGLPQLPPGAIFGGGGTVPENLVGGYGQSLSTLFRNDFPAVRAGLQIALPLGNRAAENQLSASMAAGRRIEAQRSQLQLQIAADVRNTMQAMQSAAQRLDAARRTSRSAREQYESEQRQFQAGVSTVFLVLQRQTTLVNALSSEARAETDLSRAIEDFRRATGETLGFYNIVVGTGASVRQQ